MPKILSPIEQRIIHLLRDVADRMESGTCQVSSDEAFDIFMQLRGGQADPSNIRHLESMEEAIGHLSNRVHHIEDTLERPQTRSTPARPQARAPRVIPLHKKK